MIVKFYGTRGSIPVCDPAFQVFGGNTTCIAILRKKTSRVAIIDAGTGIRNLGRDISSGAIQQEVINIGFTHFHWDHIQGFPFFSPAYNPRQKINVIALGKNRGIENLKTIFEMQMQSAYFPVQLEKMGAQFNFIASGQEEMLDFYDADVFTLRLNHPGGSYGYRIERDGKVLVICTDLEHGDQIDASVVAFAQGADLLVHEAQYTTEELATHRGWGHSSYEQAIQVAEQAGVKQLVMTHHDPDHDDQFLREVEKTCQDRFPDCLLAREQMEIEV